MRGFTPALIAVLFFGTSACAHDWQHAEYNGFYQSLERPNPHRGMGGPEKLSCCSGIHCHPTEAEMRGNDWWAKLGVKKDNGWELQDMVKVPPDAVLQGKSNPTGEAVICHTTTWMMNSNRLDPNASEVMCFVPADLY